MPFSIIWSPTARITYFNILEYLEVNWTKKEVRAFASRTEVILDLIQQNPLLFPYSKESDIHRCALVKQVSLYYRVKSGEVELLVFWGNRQDPAKLDL